MFSFKNQELEPKSEPAPGRKFPEPTQNRPVPKPWLKTTYSYFRIFVLNITG